MDSTLKEIQFVTPKNKYTIFFTKFRFLLGPRAYMLMFWNTVCSICIGSVSRKNNLDEIVGVFLGENIWFENSHSQSDGGGGEGGMSK
jgi:hypothetical protein